MKRICLCLSLIPVILVAASEECAPAEWVSVHTNEIARWKAANKAPDGVYANKDSRTVCFLAEATGLREGSSIEFFAIGPLSDRAYESVLVSVASPAAVAKAFESVGLPCGKPSDPINARLWPLGEKVNIRVKSCAGSEEGDLSLLMRDEREKEEGKILAKSVVWTGGARDEVNALTAQTNIPCAIFAMYNHSPSQLQADAMLDQSASYGRFVTASSRKPGDLFEVRAVWDGRSTVKDVTLTLNATNSAAQISGLRELAKQFDVHAKLAFEESVTVAEASALSKGFELLDAHGLKMNGVADGQFYFRAFLPDEEWRKREGRIFQPFEVHISANGKKKFVFCEEDWDVEGTNPTLKPKETLFEDWAELKSLIAKTGEQGERISVLFIFADPATKVSSITPLLPAVAPRINTFYIFH